jgi:MFS family permease
MLASRVALGAVTATAAPTLASLVGDYFVPGERARIYGYILSGELVGAGLGFVVSGLLSEFVSWRLAFGWLAGFGLLVAWLVGKRTREPARDGSSRLSATGVDPADTEEEEQTEIEGAKRLAAERGISPDPDLVMEEDARRMSFPRAALYVLRIRTNVILILAGAVGYFFFAGMRTFGLIFARGELGIGQPATIAVLFVAGMGSLIGVVASGRIADGLLKRGRLNARIAVGAAALTLAPLFVAPALLVGTVILAVPAWALVAALLAAPNPPIDAARLDIVPAAIWGRAEAIRTAAKSLLQAAAPLVFGAVATWMGGAGRIPSGSGGHISGPVVTGLRDAFLVMLIPLFVSGVIVWLARRTYRRDIATALASDEAQQRFRTRPEGRARRVSRPWRRSPSPSPARR